MAGVDPVRKAHADAARRSRARGAGRGITAAAQTEAGEAVDAMIARAAVAPGTAAVAAAIFGTRGPARQDFTGATGEPEPPAGQPEPGSVDEIIRGARSARPAAAHERIFGSPPEPEPEPEAPEPEAPEPEAPEPEAPEPGSVDEIIRGARSATTSAAHERIFGPPAADTDTENLGANRP